VLPMSARQAAPQPPFYPAWLPERVDEKEHAR